ncbi:protein phosphatase 2C domain-containing protein [Streptosporangium soli]|nr:protein phosphatase 2C domain-containing protein [Streptosporangium sp. KLBMP 9127]
MRIDMVSVPSAGGVLNEDFIGAAVPSSDGGGVAIALDGVSPPAYGETGCVHNPAWFVARLGGALLDLAVTHHDRDLRRCLSEAVSRTAAAHVSTCDLRHVRTPQATVAIVRWGGDEAEYLVLADTVILMESVDGAFSSIIDTRLDEVRARAEFKESNARLRKFVAGTEEWHAAMRAHQEFVDDGFRNKEGGFFTAAGDPGVAARAVHGRLPRAQVRSVGLVTDGAGRWTEVFGRGSWEELFVTLKKQGARRLIDAVREIELSDPGRTRFPRGKMHDDASAVFVEL